MNNNSIIKTKLQLIPGIILLLFGIFLVYVKFSNYPDSFWVFTLLHLLAGLFAVLMVVFIIISVIIIFVKVIKKSNEYTLLKKTSLMILEFIILSSILYYISLSDRGRDFIESSFHPSTAQTEEYIQRLNKLAIGKGVSQSEVDSIRLLFKDETPSKTYDMQKGKYQLPQGGHGERQNNLLKIEKLDQECRYADTKKTAYFEDCADGDLYVRYGWDACFPHQLDCMGENYFEDYLIRNVNGKYEIIKTY